MLHSHYSMIIFFIQLFFYSQFSNANSMLTAKEKQSNEAQQNQHYDFIVNLPYVTTT